MLKNRIIIISSVLLLMIGAYSFISKTEEVVEVPAVFSNIESSDKGHFYTDSECNKNKV